MSVQNPVCDRLRNIFFYSTFDERRRNFTGLCGISQFFHCGEGWYFWLAEKQGVYEIESLSSQKQSNCWRADFLLKYYPCPEENVFEDFSLLEQFIRIRYPFDQGTPTPESRKELDRNLFTIGKIVIFSHLDSFLLVVESCERLASYWKNEFRAKLPTGEEIILKEGETDRNVQGWTLSWEYFNFLVKAFCSALKSSPTLVALKKFRSKPGSTCAEKAIPTAYQMAVMVIPRCNHNSRTEILIAGKEFLSGALLFTRENRRGYQTMEKEFVSEVWWDQDLLSSFPGDLCV